MTTFSSVLSRAQTMFKLQALIKRDMKKLAANITQEQGKTLPDAEGDVSRGLQVGEDTFVGLTRIFDFLECSLHFHSTK